MRAMGIWKVIGVFVVVGLCAAAIPGGEAPGQLAARDAIQSREPAEVLFSPRGGCTEAIVTLINSSRESIQVQAYRLTSAPIAQALIAAHARGVRVTVLLDDRAFSPNKYSDASPFINAGMRVFLDDRHSEAHNKVIIMDRRCVVTGSFNFTAAAEDRNAENLLILRNMPKVIAAYMENFDAHLQHSQPVQPIAVEKRPPGRRIIPMNARADELKGEWASPDGAPPVRQPAGHSPQFQESLNRQRALRAYQAALTAKAAAERAAKEDEEREQEKEKP